MYKKIFLDSDIILDFIAQREGFADRANAIFHLIDDSQIKAYSSSVIISNIYYLLSNTFKIKNARSIIKTLSKKIKIIAISEDHILKALDYLAIKDFEDALQVFCALETKVDCLITRNIKDFKNDLDLTILRPDEFLTITKLV